MVLIGVALATPSFCQEMGAKRHHRGDQNATQKPSKVDDKAYNAALSRIPNQKRDPWRDMR